MNLSEIAPETQEMLIYSMLAFLLAMFLTPIYTHIAFKFQWWKKERNLDATGSSMPIKTKLHAYKHKRHIPTMAGMIGLVAIAVITLFWNFDQRFTWLPIAAMLGGGLVGLIDDIINLRGSNLGVAGLRPGIKFTLISILGLALGWWFYAKLGYDAINIPFDGVLHLGWLIIPVFAFIVVATGNAVNISDGLDGLAGGLLAISYGTFGLIAFLQASYPLAALCFTVVGALLAYIWFNIYPARFWMGDIGSFAFGAGLGVVAMFTNSVLLLPVIGFIFVVEAGSSLLQIASKKLRHGKKIFISAPIHHHLEAKGWEETKITMRFWVLAAITAFIGLVLAIAGGII